MFFWQSREQLENKQAWLYMAALLIGGIFGILAPQAGSSLHIVISPILALLLFAMFSQIPFLQLRQSLTNGRFMAALLISNFAAVPLLVFGLTQLFPQSPPILMGVYLVLLAPCIDYVIVFTKLGRGDEKLMLAATPLLFVAQVIFLPLYTWLFLGKNYRIQMKIAPFAEAFLILIVIPLLLAVLVQLWGSRRAQATKMIDAAAWLPVPLMALVLLVIAASQISKVYTEFAQIAQAVPVYVLFMLFMPLCARLIARLFRLEVTAARALIFSSSTRNSLVVLPLALALPGDSAALVSAVIVTQTIVELVGELVYIWAVPSLLIRD